MSPRSLWLTVTALALTLAACRPAGEAPAFSEQDRAAIAAVPDAYQRAALAGDDAAVAALYTEDGIQMPPNLPLRSGRAAIQAALQADPATVTSLTITTAEIDGVGDLAYDRGSYSITVSVPGQAQPVSEQGKYLVVLRKQPDGSWLISSLIWNSDQPLPGM